MLRALDVKISEYIKHGKGTLRTGGRRGKPNGVVVAASHAPHTVQEAIRMFVDARFTTYTPHVRGHFRRAFASMFPVDVSLDHTDVFNYVVQWKLPSRLHQNTLRCYMGYARRLWDEFLIPMRYAEVNPISAVGVPKRKHVIHHNVCDMTLLMLKNFSITSDKLITSSICDSLSCG